LPLHPFIYSIMKNILLIGASSASSIALYESYKEKYNFIRLSRDSTYSDVQNFDLFNTETYFKLQEKIDGLIYFPGTINLKPFDKLEVNDFQEDFNINFLGLIRILKFYKKYLNDGASLVFFSTVAVKIGMPYHASVSANKSAVSGLTRSLAAEWAPRFRVNCISPSIFESKMSERFLLNEKMRERVNDKHPLKRYGESTDISSLINFLISNESNWITGQDISIDGGMSTLNR
jgi:3-oxoacyl-[acyl-carrier protein] reductase